MCIVLEGIVQVYVYCMCIVLEGIVQVYVYSIRGYSPGVCV